MKPRCGGLFSSSLSLSLCAGWVRRTPAAFCPAVTLFASASWPVTRANQTGLGTCISGFAGSPLRACDKFGVWQNATQPCQAVLPPCPTDVSYQNAVWPETQPGLNATGSCKVGFTNSALGAPVRFCFRFDNNFTTAWSSQVINNCAVGASRIAGTPNRTD
jgi:hypothetical protein